MLTSFVSALAQRAVRLLLLVKPTGWLVAPGAASRAALLRACCSDAGISSRGAATARAQNICAAGRKRWLHKAVVADATTVDMDIQISSALLAMESLSAGERDGPGR